MSSPEFAPSGHNTSRSTMITVTSASFAVAVIAVSLRFLSRYVAGVRVWTDDWLVLAALTSTAGFIGTIIYCDVNISSNEASTDSILLLKLAYAAELLYYTVQGCLKFSILSFYWRLFTSTNLRYWISGFTILVTIWTSSAIITAAVQCIPVSASWNMSATQSHKCIDIRAFFLGISIPHIILDLSLILMPIPHLWGLMIPWAKKAPVLLLFILPAFVMIASCTRLYYVVHFSTSNYRSFWATDKSVMWSAMEHCFGIIGISVPSMRPVFKAIYAKFIFLKTSTMGYSSSQGTPGRAVASEQQVVEQRERKGSLIYWQMQFKSFTREERRPSSVMIPEGGEVGRNRE